MRMTLRKTLNLLMMSLSTGAALLGLAILAIILIHLLVQGVGALNLAVLTQDTPSPMGEGGLRNAIVGSLIMSAMAVVIGVPIGILAGTYMAEYGRFTRLTAVIRFCNDILLSAPSIVVGLFVYQILVVTLGHFSAISGAVALALLLIPVVVRTTEDMLLLVPDQLREAGLALGAPRALVIRAIGYRAARAGIVTGILLAIARISGETAPLLFTALSNNFFSTSLDAPMASLPVTVFNFALSPYDNWQALAWAGALLVTLSVLTLSIVARLFGGKQESQ